MLNPVAMAIVTNTFTDPRRAGARQSGSGAPSFGRSRALGPVVGGVLVDAAGWRGVFSINIPVGDSRRSAAAAVRPRVAGRRCKRRVDLLGQVLVIAVLGSLRYGIIEGAELGWGSAPVATASPGARAATRRCSPGRGAPRSR